MEGSGQRGKRLVWDENSEPDPAGYIVYCKLHLNV